MQIAIRSLLLISFSLCTLLPAKAQTPYEMKAAFILTLMKYVSFPEYAFETPTERIRIGILGKDPFGDQMDRVLENQQLNGRYWQIKRAKVANELWKCHIVFIAHSEKDNIAEILQYFRQYPTLTVGDGIPNFCENGGIFNFKSVESYRIEASIDAAKHIGITISAAILRHATDIVPCKVCE
ncbi:MAG: YfiR family protein [Bernardetiaceae bacterium]|nr:YfiR family protein [Bernardetiaceae bacterium]